MDKHFLLIIAFSLIALILLAIAMYAFIKMKKGKDEIQEAVKNNKNYHNIIEQANDSIFVFDIVDGHIMQTNPSAAALLGYSQKELALKTIFQLHPKEMLERSSSIVADVWEKGGLIYTDIPFVTSKGEVLPVECSAKVAPFEGRPAIVIYARDIRERLRLEAEINQQKEVIEQKNKDITDSIEYAKHIQQAILPDKKDMLKIFPDSFILFKAKDIVSGDFFWFTQKGDDFLFAAADCTGHGVPGALMSMIGNSFLNEITNKKNILSPGEMLNSLRKLIVQTFKKSSGNERKDGMDVALCSFNTQTRKLQYAGAYNPLWLLKNGEFVEITANKFPVGSHIDEVMANFTDHEVQLQQGDCIYIFTDGFADQFGGPKGKKMKYNMFKDLLITAKDKTMEQQKSILYNAFENWKGTLEQVDDLLIIGIRVS